MSPANDPNKQNPEVEITAAEEPITVIKSQDEIDAANGYKVGKWKNFDNFECLECQFSTLWIEKMNVHLARGVHVWAHPVEDKDSLSKADVEDIQDDGKLKY